MHGWISFVKGCRIK